MRLEEKTITHATVWSTIGHGVKMLLQIFGMIVLARLLTPSEFGLIAVLTVFWGLCNQIANSGLGSALLRQKEVRADDWSTVFYFNLSVSLICFAVVFFSAPFIAQFYHKPELILIIKVCALILPVSALGTTRNLYLAKHLQRRTIMLIQFSANFTALLLAVGAAWSGFGVWALVIQLLADNILTTGLLFLVLPRLPGKRFDAEAFRRLYSFGYKMFAAGMINTVFENLYAVIIGKCYSFSELGYFDKATRIGALPMNGINGVMGAVLLPYLAKYQDDRELLREKCRRVLRIATGCILFFSILLFSGGRSVILLALGEQWMPVLPLMQLIVIAGVLMPIHVLNVQLMLVMNRPGWFLLSDILKKVLYVIFIWLTFRYSVYFMVLGQLGIAFFAAVINAWFGRLLIHYGFLDQLADILPMLTAGILSCGLIYVLTDKITLPYLQLPLAATGTVILYMLPVCFYYRFNPVSFLRQRFILRKG